MAASIQEFNKRVGKQLVHILRSLIHIRINLGYRKVCHVGKGEGTLYRKKFMEECWVQTT